MVTAEVIKKLKSELPPIFGRQAVPTLLPGIFKIQTLNNLHAQKQGPPSIRIGRKSVYERNSFLAWLETRMREGGEDDDR